LFPPLSHQDLVTEIILTLGQAFEIAYQIVLEQYNLHSQQLQRQQQRQATNAGNEIVGAKNFDRSGGRNEKPISGQVSGSKHAAVTVTNGLHSSSNDSSSSGSSSSGKQKSVKLIGQVASGGGGGNLTTVTTTTTPQEQPQT